MPLKLFTVIIFNPFVRIGVGSFSSIFCGLSKLICDRSNDCCTGGIAFDVGIALSMITILPFGIITVLLTLLASGNCSRGFDTIIGGVRMAFACTLGAVEALALVFRESSCVGRESVLFLASAGDGWDIVVRSAVGKTILTIFGLLGSATISIRVTFPVLSMHLMNRLPVAAFISIFEAFIVGLLIAITLGVIGGWSVIRESSIFTVLLVVSFPSLVWWHGSIFICCITLAGLLRMCETSGFSLDLRSVASPVVLDVSFTFFTAPAPASPEPFWILSSEFGKFNQISTTVSAPAKKRKKSSIEWCLCH